MVNSSSNGDSLLYKITFTIQLCEEGNLQTGIKGMAISKLT